MWKIFLTNEGRIGRKDVWEKLIKSFAKAQQCSCAEIVESWTKNFKLEISIPIPWFIPNGKGITLADWAEKQGMDLSVEE